MIKANEEMELVRAAVAGNQKAAMRLVDSHMPLIRSLARRHRGNLEEEDAVAEATIGLIRCLPRFDTESGFRLNTYARHYIAEAVRDASLRSPLVRFPRAQKTLDGIKAARDLLASGERLTPDSLAKKTGMDGKAAQDIIGKMLHSRASTYAPVNEALDIADARPSPEQEIERQQRLALIEEASKVLTERELHIFKARTAANDAPLTLEELGQVYGVTRERIRQIEQKGLAKVMKKLAKMGVTRLAA